VRGKQKRPGFDDQHSKPDVFAVAAQLVGDVPTEHPRPDDNNVKRVAAIAAHLGPGAAHPSAKHVMGERGLLNIDDIVRIRVEARQHGILLRVTPSSGLHVLMNLRTLIPYFKFARTKLASLRDGICTAAHEAFGFREILASKAGKPRVSVLAGFTRKHDSGHAKPFSTHFETAYPKANCPALFNLGRDESVGVNSPSTPRAS